MSSIACPVCTKTVRRSDVEKHIIESHSDPDKKFGGENEADFIRKKLSEVGEGDTPEEVQDTSEIEGFDLLGELGIKKSDMATAPTTLRSGGAMTVDEMKDFITIIAKHVGFRINVSSLYASIIEWGLLNGFSEVTQDAGTLVIYSEPTTPPQEHTMTMEEMQTLVNQKFRRFNRSFTFRRLGRGMGPMITNFMNTNVSLKKYMTEGTPMSRHYGVRPELCLCTSSIYEFIKQPSDWSPEEREAHRTLTRNVTKQSASTISPPMDLRPRPSIASTLQESVDGDFLTPTIISREPNKKTMVIGGNGVSLYEQMTKGSRLSGERGGLGY